MVTLDRIASELREAESPEDGLKRVVSILRESVPTFSWVGIYLVEGDHLVLAAWSGDEETEHTRIPLGRGICGLAASTGKTVVVPDVSQDERYLACFPSTRSEVVVPIRKDGKVVGEIDIDSDRLNAFTRKDEVLLEGVADLLSDLL